MVNSFPAYTGYIIFDSIRNGHGYFLGVVFFISGLLMVVVERIREGDLVASVEEATEKGVPREEAMIIYRESNKKVESGEWVELRVFTVRSTERPEKYPHATSLVRYWGPEKYKGLSGKKLDKLYNEGEIGKTHELVRGSDIYREEGSLAKGTLSMPPLGSRVLHRHWEIEQMYRKRKKEEKKEAS